MYLTQLSILLFVVFPAVWNPVALARRNETRNVPDFAKDPRKIRLIAATFFALGLVVIGLEYYFLGAM